MELNLWALIAIAVGVVPGLPGETLYRLVAGSNWREDSLGRVFRIVAFSLAGLVLVSLACRLLHLSLFSDLSIAVVSKNFSDRVVFSIAVLIIGQIVGSTAAGVGSGLLVRLASRWSSVTPYSDGWNRYVTEYVPRHWVVVRLLDGSAYAGILARADMTAPPEDRDIILSEPAEYDKTSGDYYSLSYQHLFVPGTSIASLAVVHDPQTDSRVTPVGGRLFEKESQDE